MTRRTMYLQLIKIGIIKQDGSKNFGDYLKLKSSAYMDLNIDYLYSEKRSYVISIAHNYVQNGDLMADPDMEIEIYPNIRMVEALTITQHAVGVYRKVYEINENGKKISVDPAAKRDLNEFLLLWLKNLVDQGFKHTV